MALRPGQDLLAQRNGKFLIRGRFIYEVINDSSYQLSNEIFKAAAQVQEQRARQDW